MQYIAELKDGSKLVILPPNDVAALNALSEKAQELSEFSKMLAVAPPPKSPAPRADRAPRPAPRRSTFNRPTLPPAGKKLYPSQLKAKEKSAAKRNKHCAECGAAFYDDSRTATRKWCSKDGCKKGKGVEVRSSDLPKDGSGRTIPLISE